jgi:hypothetical protein
MGDSSSVSRKSLFRTFTLALIALSNLTLSSAKPLQPYKKPVLAGRDLWKPSAGLTWDYQLTGAIDLASTNVDVWDIDLVDATAETIHAIHAKGKHVICYFSAGSFENWRPDANKFQASDKGSALEGWEGENWLQIKSNNVRRIMTARMDLAVQKKCDGVEPDNVDAYDNSNGLRLTANDAVEYVTFLAEAAHSRNLAIGLKNAGSIVSKLVSKVDYSVQEECVQYGNCGEFKPFIDANKPVFHVEYSKGGVSKKRDAPKKGDDEGDNNTEDESSEVIVSPANGSRKPQTAKSTRDDSSADDTSSTSDSTSSESASDASSEDASTSQPRPSDLAESIASRSSGSRCAANVPGFSSIMKELNLGAWVQICG